MSDAIIAAIEAGFEKVVAALKPATKTVEADVVAIGTAAVDFIKSQGLTDLYQIASSALIGTAAGTPWATTLATVVTQGEAAGIQIAKGAEAVVVAQAQADLIATGQLASPGAAPTPAPAPVAA